MRYVVDISPEMVDEILKHTKGGKYRTVQDFILTAVQNQLYVVERRSDFPDQESLKPASTVQADILQPQIDLLVIPATRDVKTVDPPDGSKASDQLWGQFNRFFPVKVTMRVLANILNENGMACALKDVQEKAAMEAQRIGQELERIDDRMDRKRGDRLSTGLPFAKGRDEYKALTRFKMHFVGNPSKTKNGELKINGAPAVLRFVDIFEEGGSWKMGITKMGLEFAWMSNPILEEGDYRGSSPFSDKERGFLLEHIRQNLSSEADLVKSVLQWITDGENTPPKLSALVMGLDKEWSENVAATMRAGLIGRLSELGVIARSRDGVEVTYSLTSFGNDVLAKFDR